MHSNVAWTLAKVALARFLGTARRAPRESQRLVAAPSMADIRRLMAFCGADPAPYAATVPPLLLARWAVPMMGETLQSLPYPLLRLTKVASRLQVNHPIARGGAVALHARVIGVQERADGAVFIKHEVSMGPPEQPRAAVLCDDLRLVSQHSPRVPRLRHVIPHDAHCLIQRDLTHADALRFMLLSGDANPRHWLWRRGCIVPGLATLALVSEALRAHAVAIEFVRPLVFPCRFGLFVRGAELFVGSQAGQPAAVTGMFS